MLSVLVTSDNAATPASQPRVLDVAVVGGGPGGLAARPRSRRHGDFHKWQRLFAASVKERGRNEVGCLLSAVELVRPPLLLRVGVLYALALVTRKMFGPTACVTICRYVLRDEIYP